MRFQVWFFDSTFGDITENFPSFEEACDFWDMYSSTPSCESGDLWDTETGKLIYSFG